MMPLYVRFLAVLATLVLCNALEKRCSLNGDGTEMTATIRQVVDANNNQLEAIQTDGSTDGCTSTTITVDGDNVLELTITVRKSDLAQISPLLGTSDCYVTSTSATAIEIPVVSQKTPGQSAATDLKYTIACDFDTANDAVTALSGVAISGSLTPGTVTDRTDTVAAKLINAADDTDYSPPGTLGDSVKLRVTYTAPTGTTAGEYPTNIHITSVLISGTSSFSSYAELFDSNGCLGSGASGVGLTTGITRVVVSGAAAEERNYDSGAFEVTFFDGPSPKELHIKLTYIADCLSDADQKCTDQQTYCVANNLRKKRSAVNDGSQINGTLYMKIPVTINGGSTASQGQLDDTRSKQTDCDVPSMYWIISIVLGVLLLVVMLLCVFLVLRMRRERNQSEKVVEKTGHKNAAYY